MEGGVWAGGHFSCGQRGANKRLKKKNKFLVHWLHDVPIGSREVGLACPVPPTPALCFRSEEKQLALLLSHPLGVGRGS